MIDRWNINLCIHRKPVQHLVLSIHRMFVGGMEPLYRESRPILPRNLAYLAAAVLIATLAFMVFSQYVLDTQMPSWTIPASAIIFVIIIVVLLVLRLDLEVYEDRVEITYVFRRTVVRGEEVIDVRKGDLTEIRNYGNWNLKGVKHRSFSRVGDDEGVAMKLMGKRVVVVSTSEPEKVFGLIPRAPDEEPVAEAQATDGDQQEAE